LSLGADELLQVIDQVVQALHVALEAPAQAMAPLIVPKDWREGRREVEGAWMREVEVVEKEV